MSDRVDVSIQTAFNPVLGFLATYNLDRLLNLESALNRSEKELLSYCMIRSKGRPMKNRSKEIEGIPVKDKLRVVQEQLDDIIHECMQLTFDKRAAARVRVSTHKLLRKRRNLIFPLKKVTLGVEVAEDWHLGALEQLDKQQIRALLGGLPRVRQIGYIEGLDGKVQVILAYFHEFIKTQELMGPLSSININKFNKAKGAQVFNIFCLISMFMRLIAELLSLDTTKRFYVLLLCFLDYSHERYSFTRDLKGLGVSCCPLQIEFEGTSSFRLNSEHLAVFQADFLGFIETLPSQYAPHLASLGIEPNNRNSALDAKLARLLLHLGEVFLQLEKFHGRLEN